MSIGLLATFCFYYLKDINDYLYLNFGVRPFHTGVGAILFAVLAVAAAVCLFLKKAAPAGKAPRAESAPPRPL